MKEVNSCSGNSVQVNGVCSKSMVNQRENEERSRLSLWRSPFLTLYYFTMECLHRFTELRFTIARNRRQCYFLICIVLILLTLNFSDGPHSKVNLIEGNDLYRSFSESNQRLCGGSGGYGWVSFHPVDLGLGPFIAEVTMSAYECGTLKFPRPPYPERIICPDNPGLSEKITFWKIMRKVQMESIMWGLGTAIGELPPYFMAQGARLSGKHSEEEELAEFEEIIATSQSPSNAESSRPVTLQKRAELFLHQLIIRAGFIGILLCASIPNPLFDLAGMTCGHFLVPFWSFFGATFIGKALIKVHLQQFTVIALSSEHHVETLVDLMGRIPVYGKSLQAPFLEYLKRQKENLHNKVSGGSQSWLQTMLFYLVAGLIVSFVVSIVNALAKNYHRRLCKWQRQLNREIFEKNQ